MGTREAARPVRSEGPGLRGSVRGPPPRGQSPGEVTQRDERAPARRRPPPRSPVRDARRCGARRRAQRELKRPLGPAGADAPPERRDARHPAGPRRGRTSGAPRGVAGQNGNDPSAGSPTETLLRLLLPLDSQVRASSERSAGAVTDSGGARPRTSLSHPIGSSDGRCVQRAGT